MLWPLSVAAACSCATPPPPHTHTPAVYRRQWAAANMKVLTGVNSSREVENIFSGRILKRHAMRPCHGVSSEFVSYGRVCQLTVQRRRSSRSSVWSLQSAPPSLSSSTCLLYLYHMKYGCMWTCSHCAWTHVCTCTAEKGLCVRNNQWGSKDGRIDWKNLDSKVQHSSSEKESNGLMRIFMFGLMQSFSCTS